MVVIDTIDPAHVVALLTTRQNIYTDPQKPVQVEPKVYEINDPGPDAPRHAGPVHLPLEQVPDVLERIGEGIGGEEQDPKRPDDRPDPHAGSPSVARRQHTLSAPRVTG